MRSIVLPFGRVGLIASRNYSCRKPTHADPQCVAVNPKCYAVQDTCDEARYYLSNRIPWDGQMLEAQRRTYDGEFEPKCCVSRMVFRPPDARKNIVLKRKKQKPFRSMWEPKCEPHEQPICKGMLPRFDEMYYKPSIKNRAYQCTWVECPPIKERLRKVCCLDAIEPPEIQRRIKEKCPAVTCAFDYARMRHICQEAEEDVVDEFKCKKMYWPCCKPARCPAICHKGRKLLPCLRLRTPGRSYSETRKWKRPLRARECDRLTPSQCEVMKLINHRLKFKPRPNCFGELT